ncbi:MULTISPECIES: LysR substrate-binding domain-containing protein [unclassified Delftia]|uniref:LysR substrate-binding domain-containing protein n=1 Tax=unclassified Delftia TaxID=2613839 RepID=UPI001901C089|nr:MULTISPECIES: LysR substrate-binding domain-containing protein [unclassified Delftia]MBK0114066.1 LysR family transcriptional regulator [Delftia sp. S65]MBK0117874.1 LysR family transcriptional regulator [Delftia sp. S67]MBK0129127.1 LysR family transcriptional regulator [Delftia sp. S66]
MNAPSFLNALKAFEASARHQSFSAAAQELSVSSAAVGQLVRSLEDSLGVPLFTRSSSGRQRLVSTEAALAALPDIQAGFERLGQGMTKLRESTLQNTLKLTVSPTFASKWLLPRIDSFATQEPGIDLLLDINQRLANFDDQRLDLGVRYGVGSWPGLVSERLMEEAVFPVCSPAIFKKIKAQVPADLLGHTLIYDMTGDSDEGYVTWETWFGNVGVDKVPAERGLRINNAAAVLQAAVDGQGIALARSVMACDDVKSGRLIRLLPDLTVLSPLAYYAVYREESMSKATLISFLSWLRKEAALDCPTSEAKAAARKKRRARMIEI